MKKISSLSILIFSANLVFGQVGINTITPDPTVALDVVGDTKIETSLFLENPGAFGTIRGSKLLIKSTSNNILEYDISQSKYGPVNYAQLVFSELSKDGLQDYDTKISINNYIVTIQGYYFLEAGTTNTNVMAHSTITDTNIEGYQIYAYKNMLTQTWFLRAYVNNAEFMASDSNYVYWPSAIDMYLNIIIYRNGFISKELNSISIDMENMETGTAPLPPGF